MSTLSVLQSRLEERGQQPFSRGAQLSPGPQPFSRGAQLSPGRVWWMTVEETRFNILSALHLLTKSCPGVYEGRSQEAQV